VIAATIFAVFANKLRQPLLIGYVIGGFALRMLGLVADLELIKILSELGIIFLLFIIGMELDLTRLRQVGAKASMIGLIYVIVAPLLGYCLGLLLGFGHMESIYIGLLIAFSSTVVVAKLLGEEREIESLQGELVIIILIIEDILAVMAMSFLASSGVSVQMLPQMIAKGLLLVALSFLLYKYVFHAVLKEAVKSTELVFISALTIMFIYCALASYLGYSFAIGAFIAGISLRTTHFSHEITGRVKPLKDFFLVLFFVTLGMEIRFGSFFALLGPLLILLAFVLLVKPFIVMFIIKLFRYSNRTSFLTAIKLGQVGEFSLVMAAHGLLVGHIDQQLLNIIIFLSIFSMVITAYLIKYDDSMYNAFLGDVFSRIWKDAGIETRYSKDNLKDHLVVFGYHKMAEPIVRGAKGSRYVVVDHNPEKVRMLSERRVRVMLGDISNPEIFESVNASEARMIISCISNSQVNLGLIKRAKEEGSNALLVVSCSDEAGAEDLYEAGADYVIVPLLLGGEKARQLSSLSGKEVRSIGQKHFRDLKSQKL